jgi:hypothetical protein
MIEATPRWLALLREHIARTSGARVARELGYSPALVSQVAACKYGGDLERVARRVIEVYGGQHVECPVLGEIALACCAQERKRPFAATNPVRVRLYRACRTCMHNPDRKTP